MSDYVIAKYLRLSQDDAVSESMSIPHQRMMLDEFLEELNIHNATALEFVDNGYTGTNLIRPGAQEMLDLVRCGKVNCIVVKDFSRFSRDSMESGYYIEQVFPLYGVRFISVSDHYDSNDYDGGTGGLDVAFKFMMHEHYSKDLSKKVKSAKHMLMKNGEYIVGGAIYGYRKNDKGKWEHDPIAAEVVRLIFSMALDGKTTGQIRDRLFADRQPTPREYEYLNKGKDVAPKFMWTTQRLYRMLTNEQYTGTYIAGKRETSRIGSKEMIMKDKSEWTIIPDSHPPIVSKEDFARVQEILQSPKEMLPNNRERSDHAKKLYDRIENGERKSCAVPYGYQLDYEGEWAIDEVAAKVVRDIYDMALQRLSSREIAEKLVEAGHPSPSEYFKLTRGHNVESSGQWHNLRIRKILKDEQYVGFYVAGKSYQDENGKKYHAPKSEWIVIPDKHPAIISKEVFEQVQALAVQGKRKMQPFNYLLKGKIVCGTCGYAMIYSNTTIEPMYRCMSTHADPTMPCHKLKLHTAEVEDAVMTVIKVQAELILESEDLTGMEKKCASSQQIAECEKQIKLLGEQRQRTYEQFVTGEIERETYRSAKSECTAKIDRLKYMIVSLKQSEIDSLSKVKTADHARAVLSETITPRELVDALVERVHVFPDNNIEIAWKVVGFSAS